MEQIVITKADNSTWSLLTKSNVTQVVKAEQRRVLLGEDVISMTVESAEKLTFSIGDKITIFGENYFLNGLPRYKKAGARIHQYEIAWEGRQYDLLKPFYLDEGDDGVSISPDFSLTGDLEFFMNVLINNCDRVFGTGKWLLGDCPVTDVRTLTFSNEKCLAVLQRLCKEEVYDKEFEIIENAGVCTINIKETIGQNHATTYEYGRGKGLWDLIRDTVSEKDIITRLYVFGSTKNLKSDYRGFSQRLKIPLVDLSYMEDSAAISAYGLIEGVKVFDNIYPHRTGTVSSLGSTVFEFIDSSMEFDLNAVDGFGNPLYLLPGITAKVHFNTGKLAGYEFGISSYDHSTKKFTIQQFADDRGQPFPDENSSAFQVTSGDEYVLLDINLPQSYIDDAEEELEAAGQAYFNLVKQPRVQYSQTFDELYFKQKYAGQATVNVFGIGDNVHIKDTDIGVDKAIRLKSFRRDIQYPYRYFLELYDYDEEALVSKLVSASNETSKILTSSKLNDNSAAYDQQLIRSLLSCFTMVNSGTQNAYLRCKLPFASDYNIQGYSDFNQFPGTIWADMPYATDSVVGGVKVGSGLQISNGVLSVTGGAGMVYPGAGIPLSTGTGWGTSIANNSANWNTAYGWGNHASAGYLTSSTGLSVNYWYDLNTPLSTYVSNNFGWTNTNCPGSDGYGSYISIGSYGDDYGGQLFISYATPELWFRQINNGTTAGWKKVANTDSPVFSGNVGIGVSPQTKLDVAGYIRFASSTGSHPFELRTSSGANEMYIYDPTNDAYRMTIDNGGAVGIGTTSPASGSKLDVNGVVNIAAGNGLWWGGTNATQIYGSGGTLWFRTGSADRMVITSGGNVGIGLTTPEQALELNSGKMMKMASYSHFSNRYSNCDTWLGQNTRAGQTASQIELGTDYIDAGASALQLGWSQLALYLWSTLDLTGKSKGSALTLPTECFKADSSGIKAVALKTANWSFEESGNDLIIKRGSTVLAKLTSAGVIQAADNIQGGVTF